MNEFIAIWSTLGHFGVCCSVRPLSWSWSKPVRVADAASLVATHWCQPHKSLFMCDLRVLPVCTEISRMFNIVSTFLPPPHQNPIWPDLWCRIKRAYRALKPNERHKRSLLTHASHREIYLLILSFRIRNLLSSSVSTPIWRHTANK